MIRDIVFKTRVSVIKFVEEDDKILMSLIKVKWAPLLNIIFLGVVVDRHLLSDKIHHYSNRLSELIQK